MFSLPAYGVLIAAYNAEGFLARAVASAQSQTSPPREILIIDDASTDGTRALAESLARADPRIRILSLPHNSGPSVARNAGLGMAEAEWVAVLDADDAFLPGRMAGLMSLAAAEDADIVADNFQFFSVAAQRASTPALRVDAPVRPVTAESFVEHARPYRTEADWGLLKPAFRVAFLREHALLYPSRSRHGEDFLLIVEALLAGARYLLTPQPGYLYTSRESGLSRTRIDYGAMIEHTLALVSDPRVAGRARLARNLMERASALRRLKAEWELADLRRKNSYAGILHKLLLDRDFRKLCGARLGARLAHGHAGA